MLITVIQATDYQHARKQILAAIDRTDGIELRLDYWESLSLDAINKLRNEFRLPIIFTLRKKSQGGLYKQSEENRLADIFRLCEYQPDYLDLENDVPISFYEKIHAHFPTIKLICSFHDFDQTPLDLDKTLESMQNPYASIYKIATYANSTLDSLRMLKFIKRANAYRTKPLIGISLGSYGAATRIIGKILGNHFTYACLTQRESTAPGQLNLADLCDIYHVPQHNPSTKIYALLGDPVDQSVGHYLHNQAIRFLKQNAVYLKLAISQNELAEAITLLRQLPFSGFSVTMPLKEAIIPLLDTIDESAKAIQAINTIRIFESIWTGFNTDGVGAIEALKELTDLSQKQIAILGAGGTARAIAFIAKSSGATLSILNRTFKNAEELASEVNGKAYALDMISHLKEMNYQILINTLPTQTPIQVNHLVPKTYVMDCVYQPINTALLQTASQAGCIVIPGFKMFIQQALHQIHHWFKPSNDEASFIKQNMLNYFMI